MKNGPRTWVTATGLALTLVTTGCGNRLSHDELLAGARGERVGAEPVAASQGAALQSSSETGEASAAPAVSDAVANTGQAATAAVAAPVQANSGRGRQSGAAPTASLGTRSSDRSTVTGSAGTVSAAPKERAAPAAAPAPAGGPAAAASGACTGPKSDIVIGTVGIQSGVVGAIFKPGVVAVRALVADVNGKGGLRCHPLKYVVADDGGDPSRHQALVQRLVEQDGVIAFVFMNAPFSGQAGVEYLTRKGIPVIGNEIGSPWFYDSPVYFPQMSTADMAVVGQLGAAGVAVSGTGKNKIAIIACSEVVACTRAYDLAPAWQDRLKLQVVYRTKASLLQPDFTSQCQAAQAAGADIVYSAMDYSSVKRIAKSCRSINYRPRFSSGSVSMPPEAALEPDLEGGIGGQVTIPWIETSNAGLAEHIAIMKRTAPDTTVGPGSISGWIAAKLLEGAVHQDPADPPTSKSIISGLYTFIGQDLGGMTQPLTFRVGQTAKPLACWWTMAIDKGRWVSPDGGKRTCLEP